MIFNDVDEHDDDDDGDVDDAGYDHVHVGGHTPSAPAIRLVCNEDSRSTEAHGTVLSPFQPVADLHVKS